jgi:hypothetical protein
MKVFDVIQGFLTAEHYWWTEGRHDPFPSADTRVVLFGRHGAGMAWAGLGRSSPDTYALAIDLPLL